MALALDNHSDLTSIDLHKMCYKCYSESKSHSFFLTTSMIQGTFKTFCLNLAVANENV